MSKEKPKIILTGGHLSPLLAVYDILRGKARCVIVGRKNTFENDKAESLEYKIFSQESVKFYDVKAGRLQRKFTTKTIPSIYRTFSSFSNSVKIVNHEKPDVILTFGGYVGLPIALAGYLRGVPVVLHEQTQKAGLTSKVIGKFAKKVCISFPSSQKYFDPSKTILTGNPIRREVFIKNKLFAVEKDEKTLLVMGGSTGSHKINELIELLLPKLLEKFVVIHQTGDAKEFRDYERLTQIKNEFAPNLKSRYIIKKFISPNEIGSCYERANVVVCRAGINTISELIALNKKAVLIPLSYGQKGEQLENAKYYEETGLGTFIEEKNINLNKLLSEILSLANKNGISNFKVKIPRAAEEITKLTLKTAEDGK